MDVIYFLIPLALVLLIAAVWAFFWAVKHDQFEDLDREANRILFDEDMVRRKKPGTPVHPEKTDGSKGPA